RARLCVHRRGRRAGGVRDPVRRRRGGRCRARGRDAVCAAALGARGVVAAADSSHHASAVACDQGRADRPAISSQGGGRPVAAAGRALTSAPSQRRGLVVPSIAAVCAFAVLIGLGTWQVQRKAWKEALIATVSERFAAPPVALPPPAEWARL